jgi:hypothetical protein
MIPMPNAQHFSVGQWGSIDRRALSPCVCDGPRRPTAHDICVGYRYTDEPLLWRNQSLIDQACSLRARVVVYSFTEAWFGTPFSWS